MLSAFHNAAFFKHVNGIGMHDGREPVSDQYGHLFLFGRYVADGGCDVFFGDGIERRRGFVEDQQPRVSQQRPRNGKPLLLSARNPLAAFAQYGIEPPLRAGYQRQGSRLFQCFIDLFVAGIGFYK